MCRNVCRKNFKSTLVILSRYELRKLRSTGLFIFIRVRQINATNARKSLSLKIRAVENQRPRRGAFYSTEGKIDLCGQSASLLPSRPLEFCPSERQFLFFLVLTLVCAVGRYSTLRLSITQKDPICQKRDDLLWRWRRPSHAISVCREAICTTTVLPHYYVPGGRCNYARF